MSLLTNKLSALSPGSHVRFTHVSGQVVEGVVAENDGKESISIQITSLATLRYDQISMMDECQQIGDIQTITALPITEAIPAPVVAEAATSASIEVLCVACDKEAVSQAFKAMEADEKKALNQAYGKFQSFLSSHEAPKCEEAIQLIWDVIDHNNWDYNPRINLLLGLMQLAHGDFSSASESFFYADNDRYAYCVAYQGTETSDDKKLYQLAASFAAVYLTGKDTTNLSEAIEVLQKSSVFASDISGIEYARKHCSADVMTVLDETIRSLAENYIKSRDELSDIEKLLEKLRAHYPNTEIGSMITDYLGKLPENVVTIKEEATNDEPDLTKEYEGKLVSYKFYEDKGKIENDNGEQYVFDIKDVTDVSLKNQIKKITTTKDFAPIAVKFMLTKRAGKFVAVSIKRGTQQIAPPPPPPPPQVDQDSMAYANTLFTQKNYLGAITIYKKHMEDKDWEVAFTQIIMCYLALSNESDEHGYLEELKAFVEKYIAQTTKNTKTLEALQQYYMKLHDNAGAISALNDLMELCASNEYGRILHYLFSKARCYRAMKSYQSAVSELLDWLDIVKRNKMKERQPQRDSTIYIELAELYFELDDYDNAEKYANLSTAAERKQALKEKLTAKRAELAPPEPDDISDEDYGEEEMADDGIASEPEESLQTAYEGYTDIAGYDALGMDDRTVITKAMAFKADQLYCLLTYLNCAAVLSSNSKLIRTDENGETTHVGQAIKTANAAVSYAFNSSLMDSEYLSTEIMAVFDEAQKYIPAIAPSMFAASTLYALFNTPSIPDYGINDFSVVIEDFGLQQYSSLLPLIGDLISFREKTGYGMDSFAAYKTGSDVLATIISEAKECCTSVDMRNDVFESQGQVRRMREFMFSGEESELRICLNIVAENNTDRFQFVKNAISDLFIRTGKPISIENLDVKKLDKYIDRFWDLARDVIQDEGRHISRPHDKIKGSKRNNVVITMRRILCCICDWIAVVEHSSGNENAYAQSQYNELAPKVISELTDIIKACADTVADKGFDWGTESVRRAAVELLAKMNGTYNNKTKRYLFIDFLRGEDILLNDNYLPEIQSTFCNLPDFNILHRIERHASRTHIDLSERLTEILSNVESKHNFRTARLIKAYGEDMGIHEITEHKDISQYEECLKQAKRRFETMYQDFSDELELYESYGMLSNINGEKDEIAAIAFDWYRISKVTNDYGFYVRLLEVIRNMISVKAAKKGEQLMRQLDELADKPDINFGVFSKEAIEEKINDQNYSSAEFIMNCILRGDVNEISDYSDEPFGYFGEFINEYATNSRAVRGAGRDITDTIFEYSGKKDLEKALIVLTNNARKETKGGANLLKSWIPRGGRFSDEKRANVEEAERIRLIGVQIEKLLTMLGLKVQSITRDETVSDDAYHVFCRKQIGKVNYVHHIPAFGSKSETEGFRVLCLYGTYNCDGLMDKFRSVNATAKHTLVLLDFALNIEERRRLARKIKEEKSFSKTFIVIDRVVLFYLAKHYAENTVIRRMMAVTLPFAYYQPFVEESRQDMPPELFTGREAELTSIESPEGASLVYGGRQLGKSALLKMAKRNIDKNGNGGRAVLIDIQKRTAAEAAKIVCDRLIIEGILDESCKCDTWTDLAGHLQKRLMDENPETRINYLLLMLDEADTFIQTSGDTEDQPITALKSLPSEQFKLVMAGLHNLSRYNREVTHGNSNLIHLNYIIVRQFRREEATKLLTSILAYLGFRFNQKIIDNILASTYNYPGLIQFYCQKLLEAMKNEDYAGYGESGTPPYEVTESHYKKVLSDTAFTEKVNEKLEATLFTEEKGRSNYHIIALILAYLYYAEPNEKGYTESDMLKVAEEYRINRVTSLKPEQLSEILSEMCDLNVITVMDGNYRFVTDGFRKLLGSQETVEKSMGDYFEEVIAI